MRLNEIETVDFFQDVTIFWASLSDMPEAVQGKAKEIDGQKYDAQGFGACVAMTLLKVVLFLYRREPLNWRRQHLLCGFGR